jgi:hypothetical protein
MKRLAGNAGCKSFTGKCRRPPGDARHSAGFPRHFSNSPEKHDAFIALDPEISRPLRANPRQNWGVPSGLYTASTLLVLGGAFEYIPRKPEETVLYGAIAEQLETFLFPEQF